MSTALTLRIHTLRALIANDAAQWAHFDSAFRDAAPGTVERDEFGTKLLLTHRRRNERIAELSTLTAQLAA